MSYPKDFTRHCKEAVVELELACLAGVVSKELAELRERSRAGLWFCAESSATAGSPRLAALGLCSAASPWEQELGTHQKLAETCRFVCSFECDRQPVSAVSVRDIVLITAFLVEIAEMQLLK